VVQEKEGEGSRKIRNEELKKKVKMLTMKTQ
jgi:hypothetical protein